MADSIITNKMRGAIGVETMPVTQEVEKGAIIPVRPGDRRPEPALHRRSGRPEESVRRAHRAANLPEIGDRRPAHG